MGCSEAAITVKPPTSTVKTTAPAPTITTKKISLSEATVKTVQGCIKMPVGFESQTPSGVVQITDQVFNLEFKEKVQVNNLGPGFSFNSSILAPVKGYGNEVVAIKRLTLNNFSTTTPDNSMKDMWYQRSWVMNGSPVAAGTPGATQYHNFVHGGFGGTFEIYYFGNPDTTVTAQGLQIYNEQGQPTFSYNKRYMKVVGVLPTPATTPGVAPTTVSTNTPAQPWAILAPCTYRTWRTGNNTTWQMDGVNYSPSTNQLTVGMVLVGAGPAAAPFKQQTSGGNVVLIDTSGL